MEKIKCAAIQYRIKGMKKFRIVKGMSHAQCIAMLAAMELPVAERDIKNERQGFITTTDRFVDREEAYQIAKSAGQLKQQLQCECLFSEYTNFCLE